MHPIALWMYEKTPNIPFLWSKIYQNHMCQVWVRAKEYVPIQHLFHVSMCTCRCVNEKGLKSNYLIVRTTLPCQKVFSSCVSVRTFFYNNKRNDNLSGRDKYYLIFYNITLLLVLSFKNGVYCCSCCSILVLLLPISHCMNISNIIDEEFLLIRDEVQVMRDVKFPSL